MEWYTCLDEYEKLVIRMTTPRVVIGNAVCPTATLVKVDSSRRDGILLDACSSFSRSKSVHQEGLHFIRWSMVHGCHEFNGLTALELTGTDRVGLPSEVFAVLADLQCDVVDAKLWTHNGRIASLIFVKDCNSGFPINDSQQIDRIEARLRNILRGDNHVRSVRTSVSSDVIHTDQRLHQMMFADRDYERKPVLQSTTDSPVMVAVQNWAERGYSIVNVQCKDRAKLLFDVVCTLTDMQYVVFHATINTAGDKAYMEFNIRHTDGIPISSEPEKQRVIQCLLAAVERRASNGVRSVLCIPADPKIIELVIRKIGLGYLKVKDLPLMDRGKTEREEQTVGVGGAVLLSLGNLHYNGAHNSDMTLGGGPKAEGTLNK
ncbi:ACT domain-containing protein ACR8 [Hibiscus syriacus]|uniref:ACT domain-containing protein ACR n=1 Tax=Hibiscus syriacus TaxID=106335 RepID=A0A6A3CC68_HIBSY|nr:ACT domain-containing protein ACR8 [Hibiscus syriacus]